MSVTPPVTAPPVTTLPATTPPPTTPPPATAPPINAGTQQQSGLDPDLDARFDALKVKSSITQLITLPTPNSTINFASMSIPRQRNPVVPGVVLPAHAVEVFSSLKKWGADKGLLDDDKDLTAMVMSLIQCLVSFSTSPKATPKELHKTVIQGASKDGVEMLHSDSRNIITTALSAYNYENPERQFGRSISSAIIGATSAGIVQPNYKVCASHGLPPEYYAYGADCILVNARTHGYSASLAAELARMVAINKSNSGSSKVHNLYEYSTASPQIFTGGRQTGGR
nr:major capsid protein [Sugarcane mild mosaic virus]